MHADGMRSWAQGRGYRIAWGQWGAFQEAFDELARRRRTGELDEAFDKEYLTPSSGPVSEPGGPDRWVIIVLVPRPAHSVAFTSRGRSFKLLLPPTYVRYNATRDQVLQDLVVSVFHGRAVPQPLPALLKDVAARLRLVTYGRNNVTYAEGLGSYFQLVGCSTTEDLSEGAVEPRPPARLAACDSCDACAAACPTAAIPSDRFLLRAERCLVYYNERAVEFPSWIPSSAHRCLMGCLQCQTACPANAGLLKVAKSGAILSEEETRSVLNPASPGSDLWHPSAERKLASLGLTEKPFPFWRNARAAFGARGWPLPLPAQGGFV